MTARGIPVHQDATQERVDGEQRVGAFMGADAAEMAGERAALVLLEDLGHRVDHARCRRLEQQLASIGRFPTGWKPLSPFPPTGLPRRPMN